VLHLLRWPLAVFLAVGLMTNFARADVRIESTRASVSPDGSHKVVVDHVMPVMEGEADRYSGKMVVRVVDADGTTTLRRPVETSQISVIQTPKWLSPQVAACYYNIKKNAAGTLFVDLSVGGVLQVECVAPARKRAATGKIEALLTNLEVIAYGAQSERVSNVTRNGASVFPLVLKPLPVMDNAPLPLEAFQEVVDALKAWHDFLKAKNVTTWQREVASESFSPDEKHLAVLGCVEGKPVLFIAPLGAASANEGLAKTKMIKLDESIEVNCARDLRTPSSDEATEEDPPSSEGEFGGYRFTTAWKDSQSVEVIKETFETEDQALQKVPYLEVNLAGEMKKLPRAAVPNPANAGSETEPKAKTPASNQSVAPADSY